MEDDIHPWNHIIICKYSAYEKVGQDDPVRSACNNIHNACKPVMDTLLYLHEGD